MIIYTYQGHNVLHRVCARICAEDGQGEAAVRILQVPRARGARGARKCGRNHGPFQGRGRIDCVRACVCVCACVRARARVCVSETGDRRCWSSGSGPTCARSTTDTRFTCARAHT